MHFISALLLNPALVGTLLLFLAVLWMLRNPKDETRPLLVFALVLNLFYGFLLTVFMKTEGSFFPWKFDYILYHVDTALGVQGVTLASTLQAIRIPLWVIYQSMIPMMICWFLVNRYHRQRGNVILAYAAELAAGPPLYALLPACGPIYAFDTQWLHPQVPALAPVQLTGMPNAFPSLHAATALVLVILSPNRLWRSVAIAFLAATCMATLSTGEHYVIDLIPGFAFGTFAALVGLGKYKRSLAFLGAACCWSLAVRFGYAFLIANPILVRISAILTLLAVGIAGYRERDTRQLAAPTVVAVREILVP
ncbi:MAG TPA: phosphatase PAP2 family protein [Terracidiphilus sp.]|nr:phosphatase PAP2 family protein [Terracidiphilus sp.]